MSTSCGFLGSPLAFVLLLLTWSYLPPSALADSAKVEGQALEPASFTDFHGLVIANGTLSKLHTFEIGRWDACASSREGIEGPGSRIRGVKFTVPDDDTLNCMMGWASNARKRGSPKIASLDFAAHIKLTGENQSFGAPSNHVLRVWEDGTHMGDFGALQHGDTVGVVLNDQQKVDYSVNGQVRYTSQGSPKLPLYLKAIAARRGPCAQRVQWFSKEGKAGADCKKRCRNMRRALQSISDEKVRLEVQHASTNTHLVQEIAENDALRREISLQRRSMQVPPTLAQDEIAQDARAEANAHAVADCAECSSEWWALKSVAWARAQSLVDLGQVKAHLANVKADNAALKKLHQRSSLTLERDLHDL